MEPADGLKTGAGIEWHSGGGVAEEGYEVGEVLGSEGGFEAYGHEGEAGGFEGGDFVAAEGAGGGVG